MTNARSPISLICCSLCFSLINLKKFKVNVSVQHPVRQTGEIKDPSYSTRSFKRAHGPFHSYEIHGYFMCYSKKHIKSSNFMQMHKNWLREPRFEGKHSPALRESQWRRDWALPRAELCPELGPERRRSPVPGSPSLRGDQPSPEGSPVWGESQPCLREPSDLSPSTPQLCVLSPPGGLRKGLQ